MAPPVRHKDRWIVRASLAGLFVVLCFLAAFSIVTERGVARKSALADRATRLSATYQDARHWGGATSACRPWPAPIPTASSAIRSRSSRA